jgi:hypothetical protein
MKFGLLEQKLDLKNQTFREKLSENNAHILKGLQDAQLKLVAMVGYSVNVVPLMTNLILTGLFGPFLSFRLQTCRVLNFDDKGLVLRRKHAE